MDFSTDRHYSVVRNLLFQKPRRDKYAWALFGFTLLFAGWMFVERGPKVAVLAGGGLILLTVWNVLPLKYYRVSVALRVVGMLYYLFLWGAIILLFPDAPTFFEGNW